MPTWREREGERGIERRRRRRGGGGRASGTDTSVSIENRERP
jgi:hypothetical protein